MKSSSMTGSHPPVTEPLSRKKRWTWHLIEATIGAVFGAAMGFGGAYFVMETGVERWTVAEFASLAIALMLLVLGGFMAFMTGNIDRYRKIVAYRQPGSEPADAESLPWLRRQAYVLMLAGPLLAAPPVVVHLGLTDSARMLAAVVILLVLAFQTWLNWSVFRESDEMVRQVSMIAGAWCFFGLQLALFVWAVLAKLVLVADIDSWTMVTVLMGTYLVASAVIGTRRGLGEL